MSLQTSLLPLLHHHQLQTHQIPCLILIVSAEQVKILTAFSKDCFVPLYSIECIACHDELHVCKKAISIPTIMDGYI